MYMYIYIQPPASDPDYEVVYVEEGSQHQPVTSRVHMYRITKTMQKQNVTQPCINNLTYIYECDVCVYKNEILEEATHTHSTARWVMM